VAAVDRTGPAPIAVTGVTGPDGVLVVVFAGELDMSNVNAVRRQVDQFLGTSHTSIVFDLGDLTFMDSSGIALLVQVAARVEEISLRHVPRLIQRVLEATGVSDVLVTQR
jgi:anti-anti-sigma factor